jgi:O-antigen biosynthesis protein WbqV
LQKWIAALDQAIDKDDGATIKSVLKEAVPEFGAHTAIEEAQPRLAQS